MEHQVPVLSPHDVAILNSKTAESARIKVFVVLRMRMTTDKISYIYYLCRFIAERQTNAQISYIFCLYDMFVQRTICFKTKNIIHFSIMFS